MTTKLLKFHGKQYRAVDEVRTSSCEGCVFDPDVKSCSKFHEVHAVSCTNNQCIYVEGEENAAS